MFTLELKKCDFKKINNPARLVDLIVRQKPETFWA